MTAPPHPRGAGLLRLRSMLALLLLAAVGYTGAFALFLSLRISHRAAQLDRQTQPIPYLYGELSQRALDLQEVLFASHRELPDDRAALTLFADSLQTRILATSNRVTPAGYAGIPPLMRVALARTDDQVAALENALLEFTALLRLNRTREALARRAIVDSLGTGLQLQLAAAQRIGLQDLIEREGEVRETAMTSVTAAFWWLGAGLFFFAPLLLLLWRRIRRPLVELEEGIARISQGDLSHRVAVRSNDELGLLGQHFNHMAAILQRRAEGQGRFVAAGELIAGIAHELNNPLMAITAVVSNRLAEPEGDVPPEIRYELEQVLRQGRRAGRLLSGLLRFVRPDEDTPSATDLNQVLRAALDLVSYRFPVEEIQVEDHRHGTLPTVLVSANRLEQVFVNLISNAVDALSAARPPRVIRISSGTGDGMVWAAVEDTGPGLAAQIAERLFQPFATSKGKRGTGLGLYISREIARAAGGDLTHEPRAGRGARFVIRLPAMAAAPAAAVPPPAAGTASGTIRRTRRLDGIRILVVDDEIAIRSPVVRFLHRCGALVTEAGDGEEALLQLRAATFDVMLADVRMPRLDGVGLFHQMQLEHAEMVPRVLFLSGDISQLAGRGIQAERVVLKPIELATLEQRLAELYEECGRR